MNRRDLFRGIVGVGAGLVLPPTVADAAEEVGKRYWSLGAVPRADQVIDMWDQDFIQTMPHRYGPPMPPPMQYVIRCGWFPVDASGVDHARRVQVGDPLTFYDNQVWVDYVVTEKVPGGVRVARSDV